MEKQNETFSYNVKKEILEKNLSDNSYISNLNIFLGYFISENTKGMKRNYIFRTDNEYNIEYLYKILEIIEVEKEIYSIGKIFSIEYVLTDEILKELKDIIKNEEYDKELILRGVFLGSGYLSVVNGNYHMELKINETEIEGIDGYKLVQEILNQTGVEYKVKKTKKDFYFKKIEDIGKIIAFIGAKKAFFEIQDMIAKNQVINNYNRVINFETANMTKSMQTALKQIEKIKQLKENGKINKLTFKEREIAKIRLEHPDYSLQEIADNLKISKSTVYSKLKKIENIK